MIYKFEEKLHQERIISMKLIHCSQDFSLITSASCDANAEYINLIYK